jgi:hypothetical protein
MITEYLDNVKNNDINNKFEEIEIDKGFSINKILNLKIKNIDKIIPSFPNFLSEEEKNNIKKEMIKEIIEQKDKELINRMKTYKFKKDNILYKYIFIYYIEKINSENINLKYGFKEIKKSIIETVENVKTKEKDNCCCKNCYIF